MLAINKLFHYITNLSITQVAFDFLILIGILLVWGAFIVICDKYLKKSFEELRVLHYIIFMLLIIKAKNIFLKRIKEDKDEELKR